MMMRLGKKWSDSHKGNKQTVGDTSIKDRNVDIFRRLLKHIALFNTSMDVWAGKSE